MTAQLTYIGRISTPYTKLEDCPNNLQPDGPDCRITLNSDYREGLKGLAAGQSILLLYWFAQANRNPGLQRPGGRPDAPLTGTFALRSPHRPNPIAAAVVPIQALDEEAGTLVVKGLDCLDGTPLLDIKPATRWEAPT
ncbi:SAM-dependent methyltransferase [Rhodovibrionaceae bacterium A322]